MNIRTISPITNNTMIKNNFKSQKYRYDEEKKQRDKWYCCEHETPKPKSTWEKDKDVLVLLGCLSPMLFWSPSFFRTGNSVEQTDAIEETKQEIYQAETPEETYNVVVKDVTGDETPDIVLYKKDGTKVIYKPAEDNSAETDTEIQE